MTNEADVAPKDWREVVRRLREGTFRTLFNPNDLDIPPIPRQRTCDCAEHLIETLLAQGVVFDNIGACWPGGVRVHVSRGKNRLSVFIADNDSCYVCDADGKVEILSEAETVEALAERLAELALKRFQLLELDHRQGEE
jgi:hypothetical protein